jgi:hypothetical protein
MHVNFPNMNVTRLDNCHWCQAEAAACEAAGRKSCAPDLVVAMRLEAESIIRVSEAPKRDRAGSGITARHDDDCPELLAKLGEGHHVLGTIYDALVQKTGPTPYANFPAWAVEAVRNGNWLTGKGWPQRVSGSLRFDETTGAVTQVDEAIFGNPERFSDRPRRFDTETPLACYLKVVKARIEALAAHG